MRYVQKYIFCFSATGLCGPTFTKVCANDCTILSPLAVWLFVFMMTDVSRTFLFALLRLLYIASVQGYFPGISSNEYREGDLVPLTVNVLTSRHTTVPYDFYHPEFKFCVPESRPRSYSHGLATILFGDRIFDGPFEVPCFYSSVRTPCLQASSLKCVEMYLVLCCAPSLLILEALNLFQHAYTNPMYRAGR